MSENIDLNKELVSKPNATYYFKVDSDAMDGAGIFKNDILVIDRDLEAKNGDVVIANFKGQFLVRTIDLSHSNIRLLSYNKNFKNITISINDEFSIFGVVRGVLRQLKKNHLN